MGDKAQEFRQHWPLVLLSSLGVGLSIPTFGVFGWGLFMAHLSQDAGWSLAAVSLGVTILTLTIALTAPLSGMVINRYGPYRVVMVSMPLVAAAMAAFAWVEHSLTGFYLLCFLLAALGMGSSPILWTQLVNERFHAARGLALGIASCGTAAFLLLVKPLGGLAIEAFGWRAGILFMALAPLCTVYPLALALLKRAGPFCASAPTSIAANGALAGQAMRSRPFLILVAACALIASLGGLTPHLETVLRMAGSSPAAIIALTSIMGVGLLLGRLVAGVLADRLWSPGLFAVLLLGGAAGCLGLKLTTGAAGSLASLLMIGLTAGGEFALLAFVTARYFGMKHYGVLFGLLWGLLISLGGVWSLAIGAIADATRAYGLPLLICAASLGLAALALCGMGPEPRWDRATPNEPLTTEADSFA